MESNEYSSASGRNTPEPVSSNGSDRRPSFLSVLCVLTFIGSGCSLLSNFCMGLSFDMLRTMLQEDAFASYWAMMPEMQANMERMFEVPRYYYFLAGILYSVSLAGAVMMWSLKRKGFHFYTIAQCMVILLEMLLVPATGLPWSALVWTGLFVALYGVHLKYMQK